MIVGDVARLRTPENWFNTRPLFGRTVLVTRPVHQADELASKLRELGANVLYQPAIEIVPPADWSAADAMIDRLGEFRWLVLSSANGVQHFLNRLFELGRDTRALANTRLAAIGPATVEALAQYHLRADACPDSYRAEALAETLAPQTRGQRVLLLRASRGREVLGEMLAAAGAQVEQVVVYESRDVLSPSVEISEQMAAGKIDFTTVTSSAIARSLVNMFGNSLGKTRLAAISPLTSEVLTDLGFVPSIVAETYTSDGLVDAIFTAAVKP
jgi:uroporphyrinogen III methyltransferase/synthase